MVSGGVRLSRSLTIGFKWGRACDIESSVKSKTHDYVRVSVRQVNVKNSGAGLMVNFPGATDQLPFTAVIRPPLTGVGCSSCRSGRSGHIFVYRLEYFTKTVTKVSMKYKFWDRHR